MKKLIAIILTLALALTLCPAAAAEADWEELYSEAAELYYSGSYADGTGAYQLIKDAADSDCAPALRLLAQCYQDGHGVDVDIEERSGVNIDLNSRYTAAQPLLERAAEQGDVLSMYLLAVIYSGWDPKYSTYLDMEEQPEKAEELFKEFVSTASRMKDDGDPAYPEILCCVGMCYYRGLGVEGDAEEAVAWFKKAAELGSASGMHYLGIALINCFELPEALGSNFEKFYSKYGKYDKYENKEFYSIGLGMVEEAAELGNLESMFSLYEASFEVFSDSETRQKWKARIEEAYEEAADLGDLYAAYWLGWDFSSGDWGYEPEDCDYPEAVKWYTRAAELGGEQAASAIGKLYRGGNATREDYDNAKALYSAAVASENGDTANEQQLASRQRIVCGDFGIIAVQEDGTVSVKGNAPDVSNWSDIVSVTLAGDELYAGLTADGTIVLAGMLPEWFVDDWTDIVVFDFSNSHAVGLKSDGTVVAVGDNEYGQCDVSDWTDIVAIYAGNYSTIGLKEDGTVVAVGKNEDRQLNVSDWTDIVAIYVGEYSTIGLKSDGTVVAVGKDEDGRLNVSSWTDIVAITGGYYDTSFDYGTIGIKADGTVVVAGNNYSGQCDDWTDIVTVASSLWNTVGLKSDGTVVVIGDNEYSQSDVSDWTDIVAINTSTYNLVGLKSDGTVVAVGDNSFGQCDDVSDWTDIVAIDVSTESIAGLKSDGSIVIGGSMSVYN